ncbi:DUF2142 domain-containing protein [Lysobacter sp. HA35]
MSLKHVLMRRGSVVAIWPYCCLAILLLGLAISAVTPPFHAPDEYSHVTRAMMFGNGQVLLDSASGTALSGGYVDAGIERYAESFPGNKISRTDIERAEAVSWAGQDIRATPAGTGYYFPVLYAPEALALKVGQWAGWTVHTSYMLARACSLVCSVALLILAFRLYPPPPGALALLLLPMYIFLAASAVLDPMATATSVLAVSCYMRLVGTNGSHYAFTCAALLLSVIAVTSCRANMLPLLLLPFAVYRVTRDKRVLAGAVITAGLVFAWTLLAIKTTVSGADVPNIEHGGRLLRYIVQPRLTLDILWNTISDPDLRSFYAQSFIGVLGWLDVPLPAWLYPVMWTVLAVVTFLTLRLPSMRWTDGLLVLVALSSVVLTFLALLIQWTPDAAAKIAGVQGRYFLIPALMIVYAVTDRRRDAHFAVPATLNFGLMLIAALSGFTSIQALLTRYHSQTIADVLNASSARPGAYVGTTQPLYLALVKPINQAAIKRVGILFDMTSQGGRGKLAVVLHTSNGDGDAPHVATLDLDRIADDHYTFVDVNGGPYSSVSLQVTGAGGLRVYEAALGPVQLSCVKAVTADGRALSTPGCP